MAKKNAREEPAKPQVTENEQMSDIVFILDKMELILEAVSQIGKDGKFNTVAADKKNRNSFLKIDRYADAFENFIKNFWSQLKDPTRFGILSVKEDRLDDPAVQQAIEDIAAGKSRPSRTSPQEKRQKPWRNFSSSTRLFRATRKTKVSTNKIKKKWQRKMKPGSRLPQLTASRRPSPPSTVTMSP